MAARKSVAKKSGRKAPKKRSAKKRHVLPRGTSPRTTQASAAPETDNLLGADLDRLALLYLRRKEAEDKAKVIKKQETSLKEELVERLKKARTFSSSSKRATLSRKIVSRAGFTEPQAFYDWILKTKNIECLEKRINQDQLAVVMAEEELESVPGIAFDNFTKVTLTIKR